MAAVCYDSGWECRASGSEKPKTLNRRIVWLDG
jgi:hypothetical protein